MYIFNQPMLSLDTIFPMIVLFFGISLFLFYKISFMNKSFIET